MTWYWQPDPSTPYSSIALDAANLARQVDVERPSPGRRVPLDSHIDSAADGRPIPRRSRDLAGPFSLLSGETSRRTPTGWRPRPSCESGSKMTWPGMHGRTAAASAAASLPEGMGSAMSNRPRKR